MIRIGLFAAACFFGPGLNARIGESPVQCFNRYGKPQEGFAIGSKEPVTRKTYLKNDMLVRAYFRSGTSVKMEFQRMIKPNSAWSLRDEEILALLEANGGEQKWVRKIHGNPLVEKAYWETQDGRLRAWLDASGMVLSIEDTKEDERRVQDAAELAKKDKRDLKGF